VLSRVILEAYHASSWKLLAILEQCSLLAFELCAPYKSAYLVIAKNSDLSSIFALRKSRSSKSLPKPPNNLVTLYKLEAIVVAGMPYTMGFSYLEAFSGGTVSLPNLRSIVVLPQALVQWSERAMSGLAHFLAGATISHICLDLRYDNDFQKSQAQSNQMLISWIQRFGCLESFTIHNAHLRAIPGVSAAEHTICFEGSALQTPMSKINVKSFPPFSEVYEHQWSSLGDSARRIHQIQQVIYDTTTSSDSQRNDTIWNFYGVDKGISNPSLGDCVSVAGDIEAAVGGWLRDWQAGNFRNQIVLKFHSRDDPVRSCETCGCLTG